MNLPVLKSNSYSLLIKELHDCSLLKVAEAEGSNYCVARLRVPVLTMLYNLPVTRDKTMIDLCC